jgi:NADPH:quinone reductase-like Zn-dependent oxidoreductase
MFLRNGAATTRKKERFDTLRELGAHRAEETPKLSQSIAERKQADAVLDLVGNTMFMDSLFRCCVEVDACALQDGLVA